MTRSLISNRVGIIFLILINFLLWLVIAVFEMIMGLLFSMYPQSVISIWMEIPIAIWIGYMVYKKNKSDTIYSIIGLILIYAFAVLGVYVPVSIPQIGNITPIISWIVILLVYCYFASTLPVQTLLQPRDYINAHELLVLMGVLLIGTIVGHPKVVAPTVFHAEGAPNLWPILFITIACGAISGFHSLASSGTSVKQMEKETDAHYVGYGGMLLEGALAVLIIIAVTAGLGMYGAGKDGWLKYYATYSTTAGAGIGAQLKAVVEGAANLMKSIGIPVKFGQTLMAIFIVSFAGTTLDSATRMQRFAIEELTRTKKDGKPYGIFKNRYFTTAIVVILAFALCMVAPDGKGAMKLWPVFGAINQLLAGLALLVATVYLARKKKPVWPTLVPMLFLLTITIWGTILNFIKFVGQKNWLLSGITIITLIIAVWMIVEAIIIIMASIKKKEVYEEVYTKSGGKEYIHID